ncbi:MAG: hypothetical protein KA715_05230 [Xanthomonadaceae bacterium]|nr:hypothetical protein [Xanthomonadaceae bacterium]
MNCGLVCLVIVLALNANAAGPISIRNCKNALIEKNKETHQSTLSRDQILRVVSAARSSFKALANDPEILDPIWRELNQKHPDIPSTGFCTLASNAVYHLLGGKSVGLTPMQATYKDPRIKGNASHWWLKDADGNIIDPTWDQYTELGKEPPYEKGVGRGFNTRVDVPLKSAQKLIDHAKKVLKEAGYKSDGS